MKIKINKLIVLSLVFLADSAFAMEQENFGNKNETEENKDIRVNFTEILPQEITAEIIKFCLGDIKYPKIENSIKCANFKNIKSVCKKLNLISKNIATQKKR